MDVKSRTSPPHQCRLPAPPRLNPNRQPEHSLRRRRRSSGRESFRHHLPLRCSDDRHARRSACRPARVRVPASWLSGRLRQDQSSSAVTAVPSISAALPCSDIMNSTKSTLFGTTASRSSIAAITLSTAARSAACGTPSIMTSSCGSSGIDASTGMPSALGHGLAALPLPSSLLTNSPRQRVLPPLFGEIAHGRGDVVGRVHRLAFVAAHDDQLVGHRARDRRAEPAAHDVAEKVEQHVVEVPLREAPLLEHLEAEGDAASAAAARRFGTAQLHAVDAVALEHHVLRAPDLRRGLRLRISPRCRAPSESARRRNA